MNQPNCITAGELETISKALNTLNSLDKNSGLANIDTPFYDSNGELMGRIARANIDGDYVFIPHRWQY